jgi:hypothetical protein
MNPDEKFRTTHVPWETLELKELQDKFAYLGAGLSKILSLMQEKKETAEYWVKLEFGGKKYLIIAEELKS